MCFDGVPGTCSTVASTDLLLELCGTVCCSIAGRARVVFIFWGRRLVRTKADAVLNGFGDSRPG